MNSFVDRIGSRLAERDIDRLPAATVTSYTSITPTIAMVVVAHAFDGGRNNNIVALNKVLKGKASAIPGSFRRLPSVVGTSRMLSSGYVAVNDVIEELTANRQAKMVEVAKNILMDSNDKTMWDITESNGDRFIRRQSTDDISSILANVQSTRLDVVHASTLAYADPSNRSYVCYVDADTRSLAFGYVVASSDVLKVLPRNSDSLIDVDRKLVVAMAYDVDSSDNYLKNSLDKVEAKLTDPEKLKEYYRVLYSYDPAYLSLVEETIDQQASL